jgi:hypothetical protein
MIPVGSQYTESVSLNLEEMIKTLGLFDAPGSILEVFLLPSVVSYSIPLPFHILSSFHNQLALPIMASLSKSSPTKVSHNNPELCVFKTFDTDDYNAF